MKCTSLLLVYPTSFPGSYERGPGNEVVVYPDSPFPSSSLFNGNINHNVIYFNFIA